MKQQYQNTQINRRYVYENGMAGSSEAQGVLLSVKMGAYLQLVVTTTHLVIQRDTLPVCCDFLSIQGRLMYPVLVDFIIHFQPLIHTMLNLLDRSSSILMMEPRMYSEPNTAHSNKDNEMLERSVLLDWNQQIYKIEAERSENIIYGCMER